MELIPSQPRKETDPKALANALRKAMKDDPHKTLADWALILSYSTRHLKRILEENPPDDS